MRRNSAIADSRPLEVGQKVFNRSDKASRVGTVRHVINDRWVRVSIDGGGTRVWARMNVTDIAAYEKDHAEALDFARRHPEVAAAILAEMQRDPEQGAATKP